MDADTDTQALLQVLDSEAPTIPEAVIRYYLSRAGFDTDDSRLLRLVALAAHKFVADVACDAMEHERLRHKRVKASSDKKADAAADKRVLMMEDLAPALKKYGVTVARPPIGEESEIGEGSSSSSPRRSGRGVKRGR
eukprot:g3444.t1